MTLPHDYRPHRIRPPRYRPRQIEPETTEPPEGWEIALDHALRRCLRDPLRAPINSREESVTGLCLSEPFTWQLQLAHSVAEPILTYRQVRIILLKYRDGYRIDEIVALLADDPKIDHYRASTVKLDHHNALQALIRIASNDPAYMLPFRVITQAATRDQIRDSLTMLDWE